MPTQVNTRRQNKPFSIITIFLIAFMTYPCSGGAPFSCSPLSCNINTKSIIFAHQRKKQTSSLLTFGNLVQHNRQRIKRWNHRTKPLKDPVEETFEKRECCCGLQKVECEIAPNSAHSTQQRNMQHLLLKLRCGGDDGRASRGYDYGNDGSRYYGYEQEDQYGTEGDYAEYYGGNADDRRRQGGSRSSDAYYGYEEDFEGDDGDYYQQYSSPPKRRSSSIPGISSSTILTRGNKKLGSLFTSAGALLTLLGVSLFFNKTLLRLGHLAFIVGVPLLLGPGRTAGYFLQPKKARATTCLCLGLFLVVVVGRPLLGMILEVFGLLNLFGNMFPVVWAVLKNMPVVGDVLNSFGGGGNGGKGGRQSRRAQRYDDGSYYDAGSGGRPGGDGRQYYEGDEAGGDEDLDRYY